MIAQKAELRHRVISEALKDVGTFEGRNNTGTVQKYVKHWNANNPSFPLGLNSAYCGLAVDYWYHKAGLNANITLAPRAVNWYKYCQKPIPFASLTGEDISKLQPAGTVVFQSSHGHHVGILEEFKNLNLDSIEANTSTTRSRDRYDRSGEGVFRLRTRIGSNGLKPLYYCDTIKQATEWTGK